MNTIELEEGWVQIEKHIEKLIHCVWPSSSGHTDRVIDNRDYMSVFTLVYQMCTQEAPHNYSGQLYSRYNKKSKDVFADHVVPKIDVASYTESTIQEQWIKYKTFMKWMGRFFSYMDRFHTKRQDLPPIKGYDGSRLFRDHLRSLI